jgi:hypothetical protein
MKHTFQIIKFNAATKALIERMDQILQEYKDMGYTLTVRQLYYQLVATNVVPNSKRSYKRVVSVAGRARLAGLLDWFSIVDRARNEIFPPHWVDPADATESLAEQFRVDRWINQPNHVEVMLEKDALAGVLEPVCEDLDVRLHPNKGYASLSMMFRHGVRMGTRSRRNIKSVHVIYCGDHDPSGMDMDRDIIERLDLFSQGTSIHFQRIALTMDQIEEHDPPPQWAKVSDSRYETYVNEFGEDVWELDALEPQTLAGVVKQAVLALRDEDLYEELMKMETAMRDDMWGYAEEWKTKLETEGLDYMPGWYKELVYSE